MARRSYTPAGAAAFVCAVATASAYARLDRGRCLVESIADCGNRHTLHGPNGPLLGKALAGGLIRPADYGIEIESA
jgi:hypothetical protein